MPESDAVSVKFEAVSSVEARIGTTLKNLTSELSDLESQAQPHPVSTGPVPPARPTGPTRRSGTTPPTT